MQSQGLKGGESKSVYKPFTLIVTRNEYPPCVSKHIYISIRIGRFNIHATLSSIHVQLLPVQETNFDGHIDARTYNIIATQYATTFLKISVEFIFQRILSSCRATNCGTISDSVQYVRSFIFNVYKKYQLTNTGATS